MTSNATRSWLLPAGRRGKLFKESLNLANDDGIAWRRLDRLFR
jgi:hypothetical protein